MYWNSNEKLRNDKFFPDHLKTEKMCKHAVKELPYVLKYVPDQYKTQQMCNKAIL